MALSIMISARVLVQEPTKAQLHDLLPALSEEAWAMEEVKATGMTGLAKNLCGHERNLRALQARGKRGGRLWTVGDREKCKQIFGSFLSSLPHSPRHAIAETRTPTHQPQLSPD